MTAAANTTQDASVGASGQAATQLLLQPRALDAEYEWLGYEAVHPMTWIPNDWPAISALSK